MSPREGGLGRIEDNEEEIDETPEAEGLADETDVEAAVEDLKLPRQSLSAHFDLFEFHCKDGRPVPDHCIPGLSRLVEGVLKPLRGELGRAVNVTSGYRTVDWNKKQNGASKSYHIYELRPGFAAADVWSKEIPPSQIAEIAKKLLGNSGGIASYPNKGFTHLDNREKPWRA